MDSTTIRVLLIIAGVLLIVGIYGWDRLKKRGSRVRRRPGRSRRWHRTARRTVPVHEEPQDFASLDGLDTGDDSDVAGRREPVMGAGDYDAPADGRSDPSLDDEIVEVRSRPQAPSVSNASTASAEPLPDVLVVNIAARVGKAFSGDAVMAAARDVALEPGAMDIFHRYVEDTDRTLFSMASMVKPGTFPFEGMSGFSTPGLALFAQVQGQSSPIGVYDELLSTAERLAAVLDGRIQDEQHQLLTREARDRMRLRLGGTAVE